MISVDDVSFYQFHEEPPPTISPEASSILLYIYNFLQFKQQQFRTPILTRAWTHPALVGYTWYRWVDKPTNEPPYVPPISLGLVTLEDEPNPWHTDLLTRLNAQAEAIALGMNEPS